MVLSSLVTNPEKTTYDGADSDERIKYVIRRSNITNIPWLFFVAVLAILPFVFSPLLYSFKLEGTRVVSNSFILVLGIFWYLFTFGFFFQSFLNWFFNVLIITNKKIVDVDFLGITYKNISETTLDNIEDVTSNITGTFGTVFNIGSVFIQTAAERTEFEFTEVDDPSKIRDIIADLAAHVRHHDNA